MATPADTGTSPAETTGTTETTDGPAEETASSGAGESEDGSTGGGDTADTGISGTTGSVATYEVAGFVGRARTTSVWQGNDGIGAVYLVAMAACEPDAAPLAFADVQDADLADATARVPFVMPDVPEGEVYITAFLDDNGNVDPAAPAPDIGDIVIAAGAAMGCVAVTVGGDVADQEILLNFTLPF